MMDADEAQASLDEIRERERQSTEQSIRGNGSRRAWWYRAPAFPVALGAAVAMDLSDQGVLPSWAQVAALGACLLVIIVLVWATHGTTRIEPRHRPGPWFNVIAGVVAFAVLIAAQEIAQACGIVGWDTTVMAVTIMVVFPVVGVMWRRSALRAAARERDTA